MRRLLTGWTGRPGKGLNLLELRCIGAGPLASQVLEGLLGSISGSLRSLDISANPSMVSAVHDGPQGRADAHVESFRRLCKALSATRLTCLDLADTGLGPRAAGVLAELLSQRSTFRGFITSINVSRNVVRVSPPESGIL